MPTGASHIAHGRRNNRVGSAGVYDVMKEGDEMDLDVGFEEEALRLVPDLEQKRHDDIDAGNGTPRCQRSLMDDSTTYSCQTTEEYPVQDR